MNESYFPLTMSPCPHISGRSSAGQGRAAVRAGAAAARDALLAEAAGRRRGTRGVQGRRRRRTPGRRRAQRRWGRRRRYERQSRNFCLFEFSNFWLHKLFIDQKGAKIHTWVKSNTCIRCDRSKNTPSLKTTERVINIRCRQSNVDLLK